jgi:hypothetical protein
MSIASKTNPCIWIVDSANAIITPFKDRLQNYTPFKVFQVVKGVVGKIIEAFDTRSITLEDHSGNPFTLRNAVFLPDPTDNILSIMEIREQELRTQLIDDDSIPDSDGKFRLKAKKTSLHSREAASTAVQGSSS